MGRFMDMTGQTFGRLTVLNLAGKDNSGLYMWNCLCTCGKHTTQRGQDLRRGKVISCGCWKNENTAKRNETHGMGKSRPYRIWKGMKTRCYNPRVKSYADYGARGIKICERWRTDFAAFWEDMKEGYSDSKEIDRIDPNGDYCPENCRWATKTQQNRNTRANHMITTPWGPMCLSEAAQKSGIPIGTIKDRLRRGIPEERLFEQGRRSP